MKANAWRACCLAACAVVWLGCAIVHGQYLPEYPAGQVGPRDEERVRRLYTLYPTTPPGLIPCPNPTSPYGSVMSAREGMLVTNVNRPVAAETRFGVWRSNFPAVAGSTMTYSYITRPNRRVITRETARQAATCNGPTAYVPQVIAQPLPAPDVNTMKTGTGTATNRGLSRATIQPVAEPVPVFISPALPAASAAQLQPCPTFAPPPAPVPAFQPMPGGTVTGMPQLPDMPLGPQQNFWPNQPLRPGAAPELVPSPPLEPGPREF